MALKQNLAIKFKKIPDKPGVYFFKGLKGEVLYVGKARSLKKRIPTYFQKTLPFSPKTHVLKEKITDFDFYLTDNEVEALVLELNLIKKYRPPYNVSYRDDKSYPYLAITLKDEYPRFRITREPHRTGVKYFGPYTRVWALRDTLDTLRRIFPVCTCSEAKFKRLQKSGSACLDYHIQRCAGPCIGAISPQEYSRFVKGVVLFLEGRAEKVLMELEQEMKEAAKRLAFEKAAVLRNRLEAAKYVLERQKIIIETKEDQDYLGFATNKELACVQVFQIRQGKLLGSESYFLKMGLPAVVHLRRTKVGAEGILESALKQYYAMTSSIPPLILIPKDISDKGLIEKWLSKRRQAKVVLKTPQRGPKKELLELVQRNAQASLEMFKTKRELSLDRKARELIELKEELKLGVIPQRIECFDISQIRGQEAVGSMVVFEEGRLKKKDYRRFRVKWVKEQDDFSMMKEIIKRRFEKFLKKGKKSQRKFGKKPDLVLVDGGKPQLSAALTALGETGRKDIPLVALAKKEEELYLPHRKEPLNLPYNTPALTLLRRLRDEAHRFALDYHRGLKEKKMVKSIFDEIPQVGEVRKKKLIKHFGSPLAVFKASVKDIEKAPGISSQVAREIYQKLHS